MEALIQRIPGMPAPIKKSLINSSADSPFVDAIALVEMPRKFSFPNIKHYDGMMDLDDYIAYQRRGELLREYVGWFDKEKVSIPHCNLVMAIYVFRKGLLHDSDLYKELTKYPCKTMTDVLTNAWAQIKWEEDKVNYTPSSLNRNDERRSRCVERKSAECRPEPYPTTRHNDRTHDNHAPRDRPPRQPERTRARVQEYNLIITPVEAIAAMKNLGSAVKWPERMSSPTDKRELTKWCDFHGDHDHSTEDCIALKFEVVEHCYAFCVPASIRGVI
ncbi:hypothetical protein ACOSP7_010381 [Xanthoceras sorbifolium]